MRGRARSDEAGESSSSQPSETRHFSDSEMLAYVTMRGITGHGHYPRDEALEPLVRVMYEPRATEPEPEPVQETTIEAVQEAVDRAIQEMMSEPAEETTTESAQEVTIQPLQFLELTEPVQDDNRYVDNPLDLHTTIIVIIFILLLYGGLQGILGYIL